MQAVWQKERNSKGKEIASAPLFEDAVNTEAFFRVVTVKDTARILLDIDKILDTQEIHQELKKTKITTCRRILCRE